MNRYDYSLGVLTGITAMMIVGSFLTDHPFFRAMSLPASVFTLALLGVRMGRKNESNPAPTK